MELSEKHKKIVEQVLDSQKLQIVPCLEKVPHLEEIVPRLEEILPSWEEIAPSLEEAAIVGLGVGLVTSLFYGFKTGCQAAAVASGFHVASKIITSEMFLNLLRPAEICALMAVLNKANSSYIPPYIAAEIIVVIKQLAEKHGLSVVKAMTA